MTPLPSIPSSPERETFTADNNSDDLPLISVTERVDGQKQKPIVIDDSPVSVIDVLVVLASYSRHVS